MERRARGPVILQAGEGQATRTHVDRVLKADARLTDGRISIAQVTHEADFSTRPHRHTRHDEMFYVLTGDYRFAVDAAETPVGPGGFVFVPAGAAHSFACRDGGAMLVMFSPGDGEDYFAELAQLHEKNAYSGENIAALQAKYGMEVLGHR